MTTVLKLGGSVVTEKDEPESVDEASLARAADAIVDAGAHGAKLTGAGGGGCIVALDPTPESRTALRFTPGCEDAFRAELAMEGVRVETGAGVDR